MFLGGGVTPVTGMALMEASRKTYTWDWPFDRQRNVSQEERRISERQRTCGAIDFITISPSLLEKV
jgi:hypothetical protein